MPMEMNRPVKKPRSRWEYVIAAFLVVVILWAVDSILFSDLGHFPRSLDSARVSHCQSSMNSLGKALKSYMADYDDHFPTNRRWKGKLSASVPLSPDPFETSSKYGRNWVEAFYPYTEKVAGTGSNASVWRCAEASPEQVSGELSAVTYAFNINLAEQPEDIIRDAGHTMMLREMDRLYGSVCRPTNVSDDKKDRPIGAFLTDTDPALPKGTQIRTHLHGTGSIILFIDGHVQLMASNLMPSDNQLVWDPKAKQWWNSSEPGKKLITITP